MSNHPLFTYPLQAFQPLKTIFTDTKYTKVASLIVNVKTFNNVPLL